MGSVFRAFVVALGLLGSACGDSGSGDRDRDGAMPGADGAPDARASSMDARADDVGVIDVGDAQDSPDARTTPPDARVGPDAAVHDASADGATPCAPPDVDGDGHDAIACGGDDCDDGNPEVHPGAPDQGFARRVIDGIPGYEGQEIAAELDATGALHVAYHWISERRDEEALRYLMMTPDDVVAVREDAHRSTDALRSRVGRDAAIAIDAMGTPWVSFVDQWSTGRYFFFVGPRRAGAWSFESPEGGERHTSIALDPAGSAHVAVAGVEYLTNATGGTWSHERVSLGRDPRIAYAPDATVHVLYADPDGVFHAIRGPSGWSTESLERFAVAPPPHPGIVLRSGSGGALHVAYSNGTELVHALRAASGTWSRESVVATTDVPHSIIELADGRVVIAFISWLPSGGYTLRFAVRSADRWAVADGPACGCYDVELVERSGQLMAVYEGGGNFSLGTFVAPNGVDDDCDGTAW